MKTQKNILIAFLLNLGFSLFELFGGLFTGSVAILSDSVHDLGDAMSIGASWLLEKKSLHEPDENYTFGYRRYSLLGALITTVILAVGSVLVIAGSVKRLMNPTDINYNGMLVLAVIGVIVNTAAAFVTREGDSVNQKAVNIHMLEDVLGWAAVLVGAIIMRFTDLRILDPLLSIGIACYILHEVIETGEEILNVFLMKTPEDIDVAKLTEELAAVDGVEEVCELRVLPIDGIECHAFLRLSGTAAEETSAQVKEIFKARNIDNVLTAWE